MTVYFQGDHQLHENCIQKGQNSGRRCEGRLCMVAEWGPHPCPPPTHPRHGVGWRLLRPQEPGLGVETVGSVRETTHPEHAPGPGTAWRPRCPRPSSSRICCVILGKPRKAQGHAWEVPGELKIGTELGGWEFPGWGLVPTTWQSRRKHSFLKGSSLAPFTAFLSSLCSRGAGKG